MKTGATNLTSLRDSREVYLLGRRVKDVTTHPAFRNSVASAARLYDYQSAPENVSKMTFVSPSTGERVSRCWQLPSSYEDLVERRESFSRRGAGFRLRGENQCPSKKNTKNSTR